MFYHTFQLLKCFPPSLSLALSAVSMESLSPHKIGEIRLSAWKRGGPESENKEMLWKDGIEKKVLYKSKPLVTACGFAQPGMAECLSSLRTYWFCGQPDCCQTKCVSGGRWANVLSVYGER